MAARIGTAACLSKHLQSVSSLVVVQSVSALVVVQSVSALVSVQNVSSLMLVQSVPSLVVVQSVPARSRWLLSALLGTEMGWFRTWDGFAGY